MKIKRRYGFNFLWMQMAGALMLLAGTAGAQTTYTWANANVVDSPAPSLNWFNPTQGSWIGGTPVSGSGNTIQFFEGTGTSLMNTNIPSVQTSVIDNAGSAFELGTLTLSGKASTNISVTLTMTISGDPLKFPAATGTINLNSLDISGTRWMAFNVNSDIQLGTAGSACALTITGNGNSTFKIGGIISELQSGGGSLIKSGSSRVILARANTFTGTTSVNGGTLQLDNVSALGGTTGITLGTTTGGTLRFNVSGATISAPITVANSGVTSTVAVTTLALSNTLSGAIGGAGNVLFHHSGAGTPSVTLYLNAASTYEGSTKIESGNVEDNLFFVLGVENALPTNTVLTFGGTSGSGSGRVHSMDLNGCNQTLGGLETSVTNIRIQRVNNKSATAATLTINDNGNRTFTGILGSDGVGGLFSLTSGNNFGVVKKGTGTWTLAQQTMGGTIPPYNTNGQYPCNSYTGTTTVTSGTLKLGMTNAIASSSLIVLNGGTLDCDGYDQTLAALQLDSTSTIKVGTNRVSFADSSGKTWTGTLNITGNLTGANLRFGTSSSGLNAAQLAKIFCNDAKSGLTIDSQGYIRPRKGTVIIIH